MQSLIATSPCDFTSKCERKSPSNSILSLGKITSETASPSSELQSRPKIKGVAIRCRFPRERGLRVFARKGVKGADTSTTANFSHGYNDEIRSRELESDSEICSSLMVLS